MNTKLSKKHELIITIAIIFTLVMISIFPFMPWNDYSKAYATDNRSPVQYFTEHTGTYKIMSIEKCVYMKTTQSLFTQGTQTSQVFFKIKYKDGYKTVVTNFEENYNDHIVVTDKKHSYIEIVVSGDNVTKTLFVTEEDSVRL